MKAKQQPLPPFSLKTLTCEQLHDIIIKRPTGPERKQLKKIRAWFKNRPDRLRLLKTCRTLNASHHKAFMRTAALLQHVPEVALMIGGGKPRQPDMPKWTYSLKRIGELNGIVIHRWGKGAFRMKKREAPPALEKEA